MSDGNSKRNPFLDFMGADGLAYLPHGATRTTHEYRGVYFSVLMLPDQPCHVAIAISAGVVEIQHKGDEAGAIAAAQKHIDHILAQRSRVE